MKYMFGPLMDVMLDLYKYTCKIIIFADFCNDAAKYEQDRSSVFMEYAMLWGFIKAKNFNS